MFIVYAIYNNAAGKVYIGQTENLTRRINQHNTHHFSGFTSRYPGEWVLIHKESVATRSDAIKRERQLKSGNGRAFIKALIPG
jgi:putative endonuclease